MATLHYYHVLATLLAALIIAYTTSTVRYSTTLINRLGVSLCGVVRLCLLAIASPVLKWTVMKWWKRDKPTDVYGLQHGMLHLQAQTAMWMNMGYWKNATTSTTMGEACRDLLSVVLAEAGFCQELEQIEIEKGMRRTKCLIDLGVGCGDQTVYLMSHSPVSPSDGTWWDAREHCVKFDRYVGITNDATQAQYASGRITDLQNQFRNMKKRDADGSDEPDIVLFCADAARPELWDKQLQASVQRSRQATQECWVLALDTAYHFAPSRWQLIHHARQNLNASFMAFDLCISPTAKVFQRLMLRCLTTLMGAPWSNFMTPVDYRSKLVQAGYFEGNVSITDVSEHVFLPLADFLERQDKRLAMLGLSIGTLAIAKSMFAWWGRTGVVRGIIVVARYSEEGSHKPA
ncbi:hypothetical protein T440DRAFT_419597 [Plenodomus tracheiphilus IPT5]|uniref:S-adenosyl-L-methionine-dependent methyltransferase n=1 Tax=Plenodomus tracheiphilus IPT5 TaxID=1408161 RepID=A0A6A7BDB8_9PLEO|nr:hypothetical protein T440DRAFT_419597 [Plenodomus tracheiphilus IPT5]